MTQTPHKLKWSKTSDPVHRRVSMLVYGEAGAGKTSLVKTLPVKSDDRVVYLYADPGHAVLRSRAFLMAPLKNMLDVNAAASEVGAMAAAKQIDWVVVDGIDEIGLLVVNAYIASSKDGRGSYGDMAKYMSMWLKGMRDLPCNILFITQREQKQDDQKRMYYAPSFPGKAVTDSMIAWFDMVAAVRFRQVTKDDGTEVTERWMQMQKSADIRYECKERGDGKIGEWELPDVAALLAKMYKE